MDLFLEDLLKILIDEPFGVFSLKFLDRRQDINIGACRW